MSEVIAVPKTVSFKREDEGMRNFSDGPVTEIKGIRFISFRNLYM